MPDLLKSIPPFTRDAVHYINVIKSDGEEKGIPDLRKFINENEEKLKNKDECTLGYLSHLIQDKIWFDIFVPKYIKNIGLNKVVYIKNNEIHEIEECNRQMYLDYANLEKYISDKYNLDKLKFKEILMNNITYDDIAKVLDHEIRESEFHENRVNNFFSSDDVDEFIKLSIDCCDRYICKFI